MNVGCTQRSTHSPSNRRLFLGRSLCQGTRKSRGRAQRNGRAALSKWVELRNVLRSVKSILRPVLPCSYSSNRYSSYLLLIICRPFCLCNGVMVASLTIPVISNERAHMHKDPLTALAIGVSSSVDLSVREQERAEAAPKETIARLFPSGWS